MGKKSEISATDRLTETPYTTAVRKRLAELPRHPGHDGPTVCACVECVLFTLVETGLGQIEYDGAVVSHLQDALREVVEYVESQGFTNMPWLKEARAALAGVSPGSEELKK